MKISTFWHKLSLSIPMLFIFSVVTFSQDNSSAQNSQLVYGFKTGPAKVFEAYSAMPTTHMSWFSTFECAKRGNGFHQWERQLNYPEYGLEVMFGNLNNEFLGDVFGIQPFLRWHLSKIDSPFKVSFVAGLGFSYFTNPYHPYDNPENALIGSHITNYTKAEFELSYQIQKVRISCTLGAFHFSNGHVKLPNIGANVPEMKIGLVYIPDETLNFHETIDTYPDKWQYEIGLALGLHSYGSSVKPYGGPVYPIYTLKQQIGKNLSPVYRISFGVNVGFYQSFYQFVENNLMPGEDPFKQSYYATAFFGQEMCMGHIALYGEFGIDIFKPFLRNYADIYNHETGFSAVIKNYNSNRLGLKYYIKEQKNNSNNLSFGIFIKSNYAQADFAEFAINYRF